MPTEVATTTLGALHSAASAGTPAAISASNRSTIASIGSPPGQGRYALRPGGVKRLVRAEVSTQDRSSSNSSSVQIRGSQLAAGEHDVGIPRRGHTVGAGCGDTLVIPDVGEPT